MLALDPAGLGYDQADIGLNKTCAQYVQVLHTTPGVVGSSLLRGDADFYPNTNAGFQPGCTFIQCGHSKAVYYYYASLFPENKFLAHGSSNTKALTAEFGQFSEKSYGVSCFQTTACFPYAVNFDCQKYW